MIWLLACTPTSPSDESSPIDSEPPAPVTGTFDLRNAQNGNGRSGIDLDGAATTDGQGLAALDLHPNAPFAVAATGGNILDHHLHGHAGDADFTYITFTATANQTTQVLSYLGATWTPGTGIVVVGLDKPALTAAYGASASLDADHDLAFVFGASLPEEGDTLVDGGSSVVSFLNVEPGTVTVSASEGCAVFPALGDADGAVEVHPDAVSVLVFTCD